MRGTSRVALAVATLLASLSLVAWRQSRALETLAELDSVRRDRTLTAVEAGDLRARIQHLESRARMVPVARERLGMKMPDASQIIYLPGEAP